MVLNKNKFEDLFQPGKIYKTGSLIFVYNIYMYIYKKEKKGLQTKP